MARLRVLAMVVGLVGAACSSSSSDPPPPSCTGQTSAALRVCPGATTVAGIDVSSYQATVDWPKVRAAGREFAFLRAVRQDTSVDAQFSTNWKGTKAAGVLRGAYLFFSPSVDVDKQVAALVSALDAEGGLQPGDLPVVLDVEIADGLPIDTVAARAKDWLTKAEARFGVRPIVYTSSGFATPMAGALASYPLWVANYKVTCPNLPDGWTTYLFWQSGQGTVDGVGGAVDVNIFNGARADLDKILVGKPPEPDAGAPPPPEDAGARPPPPCF
jgi:lysozyme